MLTGPTSDHDVIRQWAERHGLFPISGQGDRDGSILSELSFSSTQDSGTTNGPAAMSWNAFFVQFDFMRLALMYDEMPEFVLKRAAYPGSNHDVEAQAGSDLVRGADGELFSFGSSGIRKAFIVAIESVGEGHAIARFSNGGYAEFDLQSVKDVILASANFIVPYK